jgi:hypothetical protein
MFKPQLYQSRLPDHIRQYNGLTSSNLLTGPSKAASICYDNQMRRCYTKTNPRYKDKGARGINVSYSKKDFMAWYIHHINLYKGDNPSVGRIDHNKGYSFDNIKIESLKDNSLERIKRVGTTRQKIKVYIIIAATKEKIMICDSMKEASSLTGVLDKNIPRYCKKELKQSVKGYTFEYVK